MKDDSCHLCEATLRSSDLPFVLCYDCCRGGARYLGEIPDSIPELIHPNDPRVTLALATLARIVGDEARAAFLAALMSACEAKGSEEAMAPIYTLARRFERAVTDGR